MEIIVDYSTAKGKPVLNSKSEPIGVIRSVDENNNMECLIWGKYCGVEGIFKEDPDDSVNSHRIEVNAVKIY